MRLTATLRPVTRLTGSLGVATITTFGDATALVTDILAPKTAYIATGKVTGTCTFDADTSDADAVESDILLGKTAYAGGVELTGTCAYDADTSGATAQADDIVLGETAFINGIEVVGTMDVPGVVQDVLTDYEPISDNSNFFACDIAGNKAINFDFTISNATAKTVTFANIPTGRCEVFLEITASATAAVTWTLNSGSTLAWSTGSAPTLATGKIYRILFFTSDGGTNWDAFASVGV